MRFCLDVVDDASFSIYSYSDFNLQGKYHLNKGLSIFVIFKYLIIDTLIPSFYFRLN